MVVHDAVELFAQLLHERRVLHSDHCSTEQLGLQADFGCRPNEADGIGRVGRKQNHVGAGRLDGAHDRRVVDCRRRIAAVVHDFEIVLFRVLARADQHVVGELGVGADQRHGLRLRLERFGGREEVVRQHAFGIRTERCALEIARILELRIRAQREKHHDQLLALDDERHRRDDEVRRMAHQQVDLIDIDQLRVDAGYGRGVGLVVVVDELDRTAEQPALRVDLLGPDLLGHQMGLARGGEPAGERYAKADLDRLLRLRRKERAGQCHRRRHQ